MIGRVVPLLLALALFAPSIGLAAKGSSGGTVHVRGYTRKDGTYVRPHTRSAPGSKSGYSGPLLSEPETWLEQAPKMYHNPFVRQPGEPQQDIVPPTPPTASASAPSTTIVSGRQRDKSINSDGSRDATPSVTSAVPQAVTEEDQAKARKLLTLLDKEDTRCSVQEPGLRKLTDATKQWLTATDKAAFNALYDTFNALRSQRVALRRVAEAVAAGEADSATINQMQELVQLYVKTLSEQKTWATLLEDSTKELSRRAAAENRAEKNLAQRQTAGNRDVKTARTEGARATQSESEQLQRQAECDAATAKLHSLFTDLVVAAKAQLITKEEFATGIVRVSLLQIELNKKMEAYNAEHPSQGVVIDARRMWYQNVDHIVSEVIPRR